MNETREVRLPADLCAAAETKFSETFGSVEDLLVFLLRNLLQEDVAQADLAEQRLLDERLRDLGYL
jgi:hypothetical protein